MPWEPMAQGHSVPERLADHALPPVKLDAPRGMANEKCKAVPGRSEVTHVIVKQVKLVIAKPESSLTQNESHPESPPPSAPPAPQTHAQNARTRQARHHPV